MSERSRLTTHTLPLAFEAVKTRVLEILSSQGMTVFATIDHTAAASAVGLELPQTSVVIYGNPKGGTPIMASFPDAARDLPLRVLIRAKSATETVVALHPIASVLSAAGVPGDLASRLEPAQTLLIGRLLSQ